MNGYEKRLETYEKELKLYVEERYRRSHNVSEHVNRNKAKKENFYLK